MFKPGFNCYAFKFLLIFLIFSPKSSANVSPKIPTVEDDEIVGSKNQLSKFSLNGTSNVSNYYWSIFYTHTINFIITYPSW